MFEEFLIHNQFKESVSRFRNFDPQLKRIKNLPFKYESSLINEPGLKTPGIFLITGGRQVGKTTFLKQFILSLLTKEKTSPDNLLFLTGEIIDTHHILRRLIEEFYNDNHHQYLFIDEVNYISDWDKSIKYLADSGLFEKMTVVLTGSDSRIIKTSMKRFAGRRGKSDKVDFIFYPLSFKEFVILKKPGLTSFCKKISDTRITSNIPEYPQQHSLLTSLFYEYALHGGYLPAISDFMLTGTISKAVITTYVEWIIGDILKHNKSEQYLFEIFKGIKKTYASQVSWNTLSKHLSIDHHKTVSDYCLLLQSTHVLNILEALVEDKLTGAPKKNRKLYFCDPFILHSVYCFINQKYLLPTTDELKNSPDFFSRLAETIVIDHCKRHTPTFYIKGQKGEVDVSVIQNKRFYPIEIKWTKQLRSEDLKQIKQYPDGFVLVPQEKQKKLERLDIIPLVRFLIKISDKFIL